MDVLEIKKTRTLFLYKGMLEKEYQQLKPFRLTAFINDAEENHHMEGWSASDWDLLLELTSSNLHFVHKHTDKLNMSPTTRVLTLTSLLKEIILVLKLDTSWKIHIDQNKASYGLLTGKETPHNLVEFMHRSVSILVFGIIIALKVLYLQSLSLMTKSTMFSELCVHATSLRWESWSGETCPESHSCHMQSRI